MLQFRPASSGPLLSQAPSSAAAAAVPAPVPPAPTQLIPVSVSTFGSGAGLGALLGAVMAAVAPKSSRPKWVGIGMLSLGGLLAAAAFIPVFGVSSQMREAAAFVGGAGASLGAVELAISSKRG